MDMERAHNYKEEQKKESYSLFFLVLIVPKNMKSSPTTIKGIPIFKCSNSFKKNTEMS